MLFKYGTKELIDTYQENETEIEERMVSRITTSFKVRAGNLQTQTSYLYNLNCNNMSIGHYFNVYLNFV